MNLGDKYLKILESICNYYGLTRSDLLNILKDRDNKYLLLLLLKKYRCIDEKKIKDILDIKSNRIIKYNMKKVEEKLFINKEFIERFFAIEEGLLKE